MSAGRPWVFVDLDDTLFATAHKQGGRAGLSLAAVDRHGAPLSFAHPAQQALFRWLCASAEVVPTTGRSTDALQRVRLPLVGWAICAFGGVVRRPDGALEPEWHAHVSAEAARHADALARLFADAEALVARAAAAVRVRVERDAGLDLYLVLKGERHDASALVALEAPLRACLPPGFLLHRHDHNLAVRPPYLDKAHAVAFLRRAVVPEGALCIGLGDSLSDAPFLAACDVAAMPSESRLFAHALAAATASGAEPR